MSGRLRLSAEAPRGDGGPGSCDSGRPDRNPSFARRALTPPRKVMPMSKNAGLLVGAFLATSMVATCGGAGTGKNTGSPTGGSGGASAGSGGGGGSGGGTGGSGTGGSTQRDASVAGEGG